MVLQVPQDGKNFSGHMFIGLIVELEAKRTRPSKANKVHCVLGWTHVHSPSIVMVDLSFLARLAF